MQTVMAVKLGKQGAFAYGDLRMCVSGIFGSKSAPASSETLRRRLENEWDVMKPKHVFVDANGRVRAKHLQPHFEILAQFCSEKGLTLTEVSGASYRCHVGGWRSSLQSLFEKLSSLGPRNIAEAEAMAMQDYACSQLT